ncbi:UNVERIFIED_CONTAM: hypothetical protein K2H54_022319 [Gekko kuhli]
MASVLSDYVEEKNGVPVMTKDGLDQLVKQQFLYSSMEEIDPTAYEISIPLVGQKLLQVSDPLDDADIVDEALTVLISIIEKNFVQIIMS